MAILRPKKSRSRSKPVWRFPLNAERKYRRSLLQLCYKQEALIRKWFIPVIPRWIEEVNKNTRKDNFVESINSILAFISSLLVPDVVKAEMAAMECFEEVEKFNETQFEKLVDTTLGVDIFFDDPWLKDQGAIFASENAKLITNMTEEEQLRVSGYVMRGLQEGSRFEDISKEIKKSFGISERKATLIARDQTAKLNASITRLREEELGIDEYEWSTAMDERVRPSHRANEGKIFKWSDPPATGHVAHEINCRCLAIPTLNSMPLMESPYDSH